MRVVSPVTRYGFVLLGWLALGGALAALAADPAPVIRFRVRVVKTTPADPARIHWRWGGEGLGGKPVGGEPTCRLPPKPQAPTANPEEGLGGDEGGAPALEEPQAPKDRVIVSDKTYDYHYLQPGVWCEPTPLAALGGRWLHFVTFTLEGLKNGTNLTDTAAEFEFTYEGKVVKQFTIVGPDGPTFGLVVPFYRLKNGAPTPEFIAELGSLRDYAERRVAQLAAQPWGQDPVPKRYAIITDCYGYRPGAGYACRTTDKDTMLAEFKALRLLGMNGIRGCPEFIYQMVRKGEGLGKEFGRLVDTHLVGYPIPTASTSDSGIRTVPPGAGCPYDPNHRQAIPAAVNAAVNQALNGWRGSPVEELWGLTVDEIGCVFDGAGEGKEHQGACPYCRKAFREFVQRDGATLADFGATDWEDVRSTYGYWAKTWAERVKDEAAAKAAADAARNARDAALVAKSGGNLRAEDETETDEALADAKEAPREGTGAAPTQPDRQMRLSARGQSLLWYYSGRFINEASADLFSPLREACAAANQQKREALARGDLASPAAKQPFIYSYALRGNTFLMGGHSLDFFDFYRAADNAFVYETSNRDWRVWQWDSYLCDVGRTLSRTMGKRFGIYVKPHRGAPIQRVLTAVSRGARMLYWYTYGPEWTKGDSFSANPALLNDVGRAARLIAAGEDVTYDGVWAVPPAVAVVRPRTSDLFGNSANWENGKWVYVILQHSHVPVDALDEGLLLSEDLAHYRVICISGSHLRRDVAAKLAAWVEGGGTLYTSAGGLARDQANEPLTALQSVLGLKSRRALESWSEVPRYGATSLGGIRKAGEAPVGAELKASDRFPASFIPAAGREVLDPVADGDVCARYADGGPAVVRHPHGKGVAWTVGIYAGLEYAHEIMAGQDYLPAKRAYVAAPVLEAGVTPVVDAAVPTVEGVLLRNEQSGRLAALLMNWSFRGRELTACEKLTVRFRGLGAARTVRSAALKQQFPLTAEGEVAQVVLPRLDEGDMLLFE